MNIELASTSGQVTTEFSNNQAKVKKKHGQSIINQVTKADSFYSDLFLFGTAVFVLLPIAVKFSPFSTVFFWHCFFMVWSWIFFSLKGFLVYFPVSYNGSGRVRTNMDRQLHKKMQLCVGIGTFCGLFAILFNKLFIVEKSIYPGSWHAKIGFVTIIIACIQICSGIYKHTLLQTSGRKIARWHGKLGKLNCLLGLVSICCGCFLILENMQLVIVLGLILICFIFVLFLYWKSISSKFSYLPVNVN